MHCQQYRRAAGVGATKVVGVLVPMSAFGGLTNTKRCCPPRRYVEGKFKLGQWVAVQRYRKDFLPIERKRRLDTIGFVWDEFDDLWQQRFAALLKFRRGVGHCRVAILYNDGNCKLGWWVSTQRRNKNKLSVERGARLNKIGFVWNTYERR